jgi:hypothetical protein
MCGLGRAAGGAFRLLPGVASIQCPHAAYPSSGPQGDTQATDTQAAAPEVAEDAKCSSQQPMEFALAVRWHSPGGDKTMAHHLPLRPMGQAFDGLSVSPPTAHAPQAAWTVMHHVCHRPHIGWLLAGDGGGAPSELAAQAVGVGGRRPVVRWASLQRPPCPPQSFSAGLMKRAYPANGVGERELPLFMTNDAMLRFTPSQHDGLQLPGARAAAAGVGCCRAREGPGTHAAVPASCCCQPAAQLLPPALLFLSSSWRCCRQLAAHSSARRGASVQERHGGRAGDAPHTSLPAAPPTPAAGIVEETEFRLIAIHDGWEYCVLYRKGSDAPQPEFTVSVRNRHCCCARGAHGRTKDGQPLRRPWWLHCQESCQ